MAEKFDTGNVEAQHVRGKLEQTHENHEDIHMVHRGIVRPDSPNQISLDVVEVGRDKVHNRDTRRGHHQRLAAGRGKQAGVAQSKTAPFGQWLREFSAP